MTTATIPSRTAQATYTVTLHDDGATACTCPAGQHGRPCWHVRAVQAAVKDASERRAAETASLDMLFNSTNTSISKLAVDVAATVQAVSPAGARMSAEEAQRKMDRFARV